MGKRPAGSAAYLGLAGEAPRRLPSNLGLMAAAALAEELPPASLWEQICAEFEAEQPPHPDHPVQKPPPPPSAPACLPVPLEADSALSGEEGESVPSIPVEESPPLEIPLLLVESPTPEAPDLKTCSPREFLEYYIFPVLLPGMAELLHQAKKEKCFERKRTKFIALDYLTEWLYNHNPKREEEPFVEFFEIPFVKEWLKDHPRPPIPLSLLLTEEEAGNIIQAFWRGYRIRCDPEVQELRQWQKHLRETKNIIKRVREFWKKQEKKVGTKMEDSLQPSPDRSKASVAVPLPIPMNIEVKEEEEEAEAVAEAEVVAEAEIKDNQVQ